MDDDDATKRVADAEKRVGHVIDERYKIAKLLAAGSMGAVYEAERVPVGKLVAIKFLHSQIANDSELSARFERETRVTSKLAHPNCVSVLDFGVFEGAPYLVMEHVAGTTLRSRIDRGALTPAQALAFARQIAAGLAYAHEQGVVHRDIKPANIMISDEIGAGERVRILDFGLARLRGNVGRDATQTNMVVGTPNYMAPEQTVGGSTIDARTDVYATGVVLYEMIVGDRPFHAEDTLQLLGMHRAAPIPRLVDRVKEGTELPAGLQALVDKAMAKSPADRFQTAIAFAAAIDDVIAGKATDVVDEPIIVRSARKQMNPAAVAPTLIQPDSAASEAAHGHARGWRLFIGAMILVGGAAAMAGYLIHRSARDEAVTAGKTVETVAHDAAGLVASANPNEMFDAVQPTAIVPPSVADAEIVATTGDAGAGSATGSATDDAGGVLDAEVASGVGSGSGSGSEEIEIDPTKVEDLDPAAGSAQKPDDEAADAPKTQEDIEKHSAVATPQLAATLHDAVALIKAGDRQRALASLRALEKKSPTSSYIPFLLGNLYYDERWWGVAMDEYALAIKKNVAYRGNETLNRNVIRMLGSPKTEQKAANFLRGTIGRSAAPFLRAAAKSEDNPRVRKEAANLSRYIR